MAALPGIVATPAPAASSAAEYEVKAAFIYNFSRFVQWPPSDLDKPFVVGILGKDPFGAVLDESLNGKRADGREVVVRRFSRIENAAESNILFVSSSEEANLEQIVKGLHSLPVLTIGETSRFAERGGMINLTTQGNRIRFEINLDAIERSGLKVSSQLLRLAKIVSTPQPAR
jgi:hypothetical protein